MRVRERDAIDYAGVSAVTLPAWLRFPYRFAAYTRLRCRAWRLGRWIDRAPDRAVGLVVAVALAGGAFLAGPVRSAAT